ncbi:MAG: hypothetical protein V3U73_12200 [bacterium]
MQQQLSPARITRRHGARCSARAVDASVRLSPIGEIIEDPAKWDTDRENPERQMEDP